MSHIPIIAIAICVIAGIEAISAAFGRDFAKGFAVAVVIICLLIIHIGERQE